MNTILKGIAILAVGLIGATGALAQEGEHAEGSTPQIGRAHV